MDPRQPSINKQGQYYENIEMSASPIFKEAQQQLLQKPKTRKSIDIERQKHRVSNSPKKSPQKTISQFNLKDYNQTQANYFCPKFLNWLGHCCIPCKIVCPCFFCPCCPCANTPIFKQQTKSLGLLQSWGRFERILDPGLHIINPISQSIIEINQQTQILQYNQICISKDNVQFEAKVVLFYRVVDSIKVAYRMGTINIQEGVKQIAIGMLRSVVGENNLQEIIQNRTLVTKNLTSQMNKMIDYWGLHVEVSSLKQIKIHQQILNALQTVAEAKRNSQALLINCRSQVSCAALYKEISQIINTKAAYQIRFLNMVEQIIGNGQDNTIFIKTEMSYNQNQAERQPLTSQR